MLSIGHTLLFADCVLLTDITQQERASSAARVACTKTIGMYTHKNLKFVFNEQHVHVVSSFFCCEWTHSRPNKTNALFPRKSDRRTENEIPGLNAYECHFAYHLS